MGPRAKSLAAIMIYPEVQNKEVFHRDQTVALTKPECHGLRKPHKSTRRAPRDRTSQIVCCSIMANHSEATLQTATARGKLAATERL